RHLQERTLCANCSSWVLNKSIRAQGALHAIRVVRGGTGCCHDLRGRVRPWLRAALNCEPGNSSGSPTAETERYTGAAMPVPPPAPSTTIT
ncbi:MAG: hypothetical protein KGN77_14915, partial [Xanthomonadaceae bacterium]|nr:hypothetical protein [Xanthomonadaceae bacterium]